MKNENLDLSGLVKYGDYSEFDCYDLPYNEYYDVDDTFLFFEKREIDSLINNEPNPIWKEIQNSSMNIVEDSEKGLPIY